MVGIPWAIKPSLVLQSRTILLSQIQNHLPFPRRRESSSFMDPRVDPRLRGDEDDKINAPAAELRGNLLHYNVIFLIPLCKGDRGGLKFFLKNPSGLRPSPLLKGSLKQHIIMCYIII